MVKLVLQAAVYYVPRTRKRLMCCLGGSTIQYTYVPCVAHWVILVRHKTADQQHYQCHTCCCMLLCAKRTHVNAHVSLFCCLHLCYRKMCYN